MNEKEAVTGKLSLVERIINSRHAPLYAALVGLLGLFGIYEYFDQVGKGMENGYDTTIKAGTFGSVQFARGIESDEVSDGLEIETEKQNIEY